jgi:hypothetical protein
MFLSTFLSIIAIAISVLSLFYKYLDLWLVKLKKIYDSNTFKTKPSFFLILDIRLFYENLCTQICPFFPRTFQKTGRLA